MTIDLMDGHLIISRIKSDPYIYGPVLSSLCKPRNLMLEYFVSMLLIYHLCLLLFFYFCALYL